MLPSTRIMQGREAARDTPPHCHRHADRDVRHRHSIADQHRRSGLRGRVHRRNAACGGHHKGNHRRISQRAVPDAGRDHLAVRPGAEQRHHRLAGPVGRPGGQGPPCPDPVDHVLDLGGAHRHRRRDAGGCRHRGADRAELRLPLQDLAPDDGHDGGDGGLGRGLLAHRDLRQHHQRGGRTLGPAAEPDRDLLRKLPVQFRLRGAPVPASWGARADEGPR